MKVYTIELYTKKRLGFVTTFLEHLCILFSIVYLGLEAVLFKYQVLQAEAHFLQHIYTASFIINTSINNTKLLKLCTRLV